MGLTLVRANGEQLAGARLLAARAEPARSRSMTGAAIATAAAMHQRSACRRYRIIGRVAAHARVDANLRVRFACVTSNSEPASNEKRNSWRERRKPASHAATTDRIRMRATVPKVCLEPSRHAAEGLSGSAPRKRGADDTPATREADASYHEIFVQHAPLATLPSRVRGLQRAHEERRLGV
jgi:hypothetical protein